MPGEKIALLLGAGASVADVATKPLKSGPPLDRRFFGVAASANSNDARVDTVKRYLRDTYDIDIISVQEELAACEAPPLITETGARGPW